MESNVGIFIITILLITSFFSCTFNTNLEITRQNNEIDSDLRKEIKELNEIFINCVEEEDNTRLRSVFSEPLIEHLGEDFSSIIPKFQEIYDDNEYVVFKEYYTIFKKIGNNNNGTIIGSEEDDFIIDFNFQNEESYFLFLKSEHIGLQYLLFFALSKYDNKWKIDSINLGKYSVNGYNAHQLVEKAKEMNEKGDVFNSIFYTLALSEVLRPLTFLEYKKEKEYKEFYKKNINEINEDITFPIIFSDSVQILGLNVELTNDNGIIPVVQYITDKDFEENILLEEINIFKEELIKEFPGIDHEFEKILFRAYSEMPTDPEKEYSIYNSVLTWND
ncbi:MAG: hypothetical protein PQJ44_07625 [Sphaerochaetaceae bacterium]|nr:hypothetical protein [Sphaerochaetaceae bacterium]